MAGKQGSSDCVVLDAPVLLLADTGNKENAWVKRDGS